MYYKVCAVFESIEGEQANALPAVTLMAAPGNVRVTGASDNGITLEWNAVSGAGGYNLYRSTTVDGPYSMVNSNAINGTSYADTGLSASTGYYYKVCAVKSGVEGVVSGVVSANTLTAVPGGSLAAKLAWLSKNAASDTEYLLELNADETIAPQTLSYTYIGKTNISITLRGAGTERTIQLSSIASLFTIQSGVTLVLDTNITLKGRDDNNASLVKVAGGSLVMHVWIKNYR